MDPEASSRPRAWVVVLIVVIVAAATVIVVTSLGKGGSTSTSGGVTLEAADSPGADPFTDSVATGPAIAFPGIVRAITTTMRDRRHVDARTHTFVALGTAPGLYGGSGNPHLCDPDKLVSYLDQNPDKAKAWASVLGIAPTGIAAYVKTLTPVVLTTDTLVTNHGYANGHATSLQSVLEAGTAVMVDPTGTPRVKCNCGNPLTPPEPITITATRGTPWPGYTATAVTVIKPGTPSSTLTLMNTNTGTYYAQPTGTVRAPKAGEWVAAEVTSTNSGYPTQSTILTSRAGHPFVATNVLPDTGVVGLAWGNGKWLAVANANRQTVGEVLESADLHTWRQVATIPNTFISIAFGNGRWVATALHVIPALRSGGAPHSQGLLYTSTDGADWRTVPIAEYPENFANPPVAYGNGEWLTVVPEEQTGPSVFGSSLEIFTSGDGLRWASNGVHINGPTFASLGFGAGTWLVGSQANGQSSADIFTSGNAVSWTPSTVGAANSDVVAVAHGNGQWMIVMGGGPGVVSSTTFLTSPNAATWNRFEQVSADVTALAFGGSSSTTAPMPVATPPPTTTTLARTTTTIATVRAPCTVAAFMAALGPDDELDGPPQCSGTSGTIQFATQGLHLVGKLHWNGTAWQFGKGAIPVCRINGKPFSATMGQPGCPDADKGPFGYP